MTAGTTLATYRVKAGIATWTLSGDLGISQAAELHRMAVKLADDVKVQGVSIHFSGEGVPLPTYQILIALRQALEAEGKTFECSGSLLPFGGRPW